MENETKNDLRKVGQKSAVIAVVDQTGLYLAGKLGHAGGNMIVESEPGKRRKFMISGQRSKRQFPILRDH